MIVRKRERERERKGDEWSIAGARAWNCAEPLFCIQQLFCAEQVLARLPHGMPKSTKAFQVTRLQPQWLPHGCPMAAPYIFSGFMGYIYPINPENIELIRHDGAPRRLVGRGFTFIFRVQIQFVVLRKYIQIFEFQV